MFLNLIQDNDLNTEDCVKNPWRICNIQQMEEVKCLIKVLPIRALGILCLIPITQHGVPNHHRLVPQSPLFYSTESPDKMKRIGNSLQYLVVAFSIYVGTLVVNVVHQLTRKHDGIDWLNDDINAGRLDYYYFLVAGLASINLVYILLCVKHYRYKVNVEEKVVEKLEP
ncbi:protein NRT1/ PTR FAMILY 2.12-like [Glycine soja]|uniref:protein NRT1/ PTR FAMILY 2.12-like n=1 Tax=Glycine soja TaxID=3848 RepID=UPI00103DD673|nr:protein NRT1/ PTR FAMILY 2.12-like [Glycine soja]XP_040869835.1 protein NRT1/ PTR FAMILY 2.12-like [Glycine max]